MIAGVYTIKNIKNNKVYVGRSIDIESRWETHKKDLSNGTHSCAPLQYEYYLYGEKAFVYNIEWLLCQGDNLCNCDLGRELELKESKIGISLNADMANTGYNFISKFTHGERNLEHIQIDKNIEQYIRENIDNKAVELFKSILAHYDTELKCSMITYPIIQKETHMGRKNINKYLQKLEMLNLVFECEEKFNRFTLFFFSKKDVDAVVVERYLLSMANKVKEKLTKANEQIEKIMKRKEQEDDEVLPVRKAQCYKEEDDLDEDWF